MIAKNDMDYYESPATEVVETVVEQGFAGSLTGTIEDWTSGDGGGGDLTE